MMKVSTRYLLYNFIPPFILSCVFFVSFLLVFQLFRITRIVIQKGVPFLEVLELVGHIAVTFLPMAIPISCFFSAIYTMSRMSDDSEIVALRSFGFRKQQLLRPLLIAGLFIAVGVFGLNRTLIPVSKTVFKNTIIALTSKGMFSDVQPGNFFTEIPGIILFARDVSEDKSRMKEVFINTKKNGILQSIYAKEGVIIKRKNGEWNLPTLRFFLTDGNIVKLDLNNDKSEKILFETYDFPILMDNFRPGYVTKDSMRTNGELRQEIRRKESELSAIGGSNANDKKPLIRSLAKTKVEYFSRLNTPFQCLLFIFLGFIFGIRKSRGKAKSTGSRAIAVLISYYAVFFMGISFAKKGLIAEYLVIFIPTMLAFLIGTIQYRKLDWD